MHAVCVCAPFCSSSSIQPTLPEVQQLYRGVTPSMVAAFTYTHTHTYIIDVWLQVTLSAVFNDRANVFYGEHLIMVVIIRIPTLAPAFINALTQATCPDRQASWRGVT